MRSHYWLNVAIVRVVIPVTLAACAIWRPSGLSLIYLGLTLYSPLVPIPMDDRNVGRSVKRYLGSCVILSVLTSLTQLVFHVVLLSLPPYGHSLEDCTFLEKIMRHVGLVRLDGATVFEVLFWLLPEMVSLVVSVAAFCLCDRLGRPKRRRSLGADGTNDATRDVDNNYNYNADYDEGVEEEEGNAGGDDDESSIINSRKRSKRRYDRNDTKIVKILGGVGSHVVLASLCCVSSLTPSIEGSFYFLVFVLASTWWACDKRLVKGFAVTCRIVMFVVAVEILVLLGYQNQWPQQFVPVNGTWSRYFALERYQETNCSDPRRVEYVNDNSDWAPGYGHLIGLFWLYHVLALQSQYLFGRPLMRFGSGRTGGVVQDSTGSVIVQQDGVRQRDDSVQMRSVSEGVAEDDPGIVEHIVMAVYSIFQLIASSSYLATNILMMTWSIMYHSWTTFALLMWALVLWMVPNKRASMIKCSPFIVFYATLLILIGYVYSMNLTEEELPTSFYGVKMAEIGFSKPEQQGSWHQIVKCGFLSMFWVTMRQYMAERKRRRANSALRDMVAPIRVSVSAATTSAYDQQQQQQQQSPGSPPPPHQQHQETTEIKSQFMKDVGRVVKKLLVKFWIAVVAIMLFTSGITGERMTVFRIIYMSLFLLFVITFQISWKAWRRMMYGFWITVIAYSVVMLILVYTYQFHNFPAYWEYLHIDEDLQMDIGLESYETKDLFVRLLTPTFFVIITVVQIHYFHDDFLDVTDMGRIGGGLAAVSRRASLGDSPSAVLPTVSPLDVLLAESPDEKSRIYTLKQLKHMSKLERIALFRKTMSHVVNLYNHIWLMLEIHMQKIICLSLMLLCINDVCAINLLFVIAVVITINLKRSMQIVSINAMACAIAVLMVTKMLYQIKYIDHNNWNVNCSSTERNTTSGNETVYNVAEWIGMRKAGPGELPDLLKGYIGIVTVTTVRAIIMIRQCFHRHARGESLETPLVMFPKITRADADRGIQDCLKFLLNYGFYKFGLEFCLMGLVGLIGTRLDFFSVLYGFWLVVLFAVDRPVAAKIWPFFKVFAAVGLAVQYASVVAPPTWLCIVYPWSKSLRSLQEWMFLPDPDFPPNPKKLICDFILLLLIVRQSLVFRIEARGRDRCNEFPAGHNFSVFQDIDKPNFVNPVKDYVSNIHCWLDVFKRGSMMSFMWITLSIMFLAGTKRTNIFSLGYLIGAFVFLWQGSDFYLRPIKTILKWWNFLIGYNVLVILSKAMLQGVGCVLILELRKSACWLIQLLGIACLKKFESSPIDFANDDATCEVPREDIGMVWDGLCFAFLLIQKRLFKSYYFFHIVDETKAMSILASRGAELLEDLHRKRIINQENIEKAVLEKLKFKMDKIKADQQRIQGPGYGDAATHKVDSLYPADRALYRHRVPKTNREAVRSGDYYMFDDLDDDDVTDLLPDAEEDDETGDESTRQRGRAGQPRDQSSQQPQSQPQRRMTVAELMTTLLKTDIEIATHVAMYGGTQRDALRLRRQSVPLTRNKSSMSYLSARSETAETAETAEATVATHARGKDGDRASLDSTEIEDAEGEFKTADDLAGKGTTTETPADSDAPEDDGHSRRDRDLMTERPEQQDERRTTASFLTYLKFIWVMIGSTMVSMTRYMNRFSRDYRYIRKVLSEEKKILKAKPDFRMGTRLGINQIWQPIPMMKQLQQQQQQQQQQQSTPERVGGSIDETPKDDDAESDADTGPGTSQRSSTTQHSTIFSQPRGTSGTTTAVAPLPEEDPQRSGQLSEVDQPPIIQLAASVWFGILAHSTFMCYLIVFLHQIKNASVLSIPLPLMVFFWGSLTIPRPSKTFWVTLIAYTEAIVIVKCIFQLELIPWNQTASPNHPLFGPRIVGVERKPNYALWDLLLLLVVFFHRFMLKSLGQWTSSVKPRKIIPSKPIIVATPSFDGQGEIEPAARFHWQNEDTSKRIRADLATVDQGSADSEKEIATVATTEQTSREKSDDSSEPLVGVRADETSVREEDLKTAVNITAVKYLEPASSFFANILSSEGKEKTNVYAYMFLCDFFNFLLIIFGFSSFGTQQGDGGVTAYLSENRVPMPFLLMLLLQFALIVIDRALFLRKSILGKLVFHYCLVFGVHIWMFFILPSVTERRFNEKLPPQIWYMVKCFYLLLAAHQLRLGYPTRILGNFLCKKYSIVNFCLFKGFMLVPFLFELRAVMDWIWTDTSMTIMDWFKMEDIFASIYQIKCMRGVETDFPQPRGVKKQQMSKYMVGGGALLLMIGLIWFPLLLFALGGTVGVSNLPYEVSMKIRIGPYEPIYSMSAQESSIYRYTEEYFKDLKDLYSRDRSAVTFLENYGSSDVAAVRLSGSSGKLWAISPPDRQRLRLELESNNTVTVHVEWTVSRKTDVKDFSGITTKGRDIKLPAWINGQFNPVRKSLADLLLATNDSTNSTNGTIPLAHAFPKFIKVTSRTTDPVAQLMRVPQFQLDFEYADSGDDNDKRNDYLYRNVSLKLSTNLDCCAHEQWWVVTEDCDDLMANVLLKKVPLNNCRYIMMFLFNDKAFPEGLSFISGFGILGLYTTAVIVVSQVIRRAVSEMAPKIMFDDLPYVDRILRLCLDIYLVRESGDLCLEEDLFAKLIFLYRSPETLIRWTRPPEPGTRADRANRGNRDDSEPGDGSEMPST